MMRTAIEAYPKLRAPDVAEAFLRDGPTRLPGEARLIFQTAEFVGQHLFGLGHAGEWSEIDVECFFQEIDFVDEQELVGVSLTLIALYGWLGNIGLVPSVRCKQILGAVICFGPRVNFVRSLALAGQRMLTEFEFGAADTLH